MLNIILYLAVVMIIVGIITSIAIFLMNFFKCKKYKKHYIFLFKQDQNYNNGCVEADLIAFTSSAYKNINTALMHASERYERKTPHCYYFDFSTNDLYVSPTDSHGFMKLFLGIFGDYTVDKKQYWLIEDVILKTKYKISLLKIDKSYTFEIRQ